MKYQHLRHQHQQQQELRHDDVSNDVTLPMYAEKIVAELIDTERTYVAELQQVVQVFCLSTCLSFVKYCIASPVCRLSVGLTATENVVIVFIQLPHHREPSVIFLSKHDAALFMVTVYFSSDSLLVADAMPWLEDPFLPRDAAMLARSWES